MCINQDPSAKNWLFAMYEDLSDEDFTAMIVKLWVFWCAHIKAIHGDIFQSPYSTYCFIETFLKEIETLKKNKRYFMFLPQGRSNGSLLLTTMEKLMLMLQLPGQVDLELLRRSIEIEVEPFKGLWQLCSEILMIHLLWRHWR